MERTSPEEYIIKKIDYINNKSINHLNKIENNFKELKDAFYELTKEYDLNKISTQEENDKDNATLKNKNINKDLNSINEIISQLISEEYKNNINYIDNYLNKFNSNTCIPSINEQLNIKDKINKIENEMKDIILNLEEKVKNLKLEKTNNIQTINIEMNNEINNIIKKINDISLDLIISNSEKANSIQDVIQIYLNKSNGAKKEFNEFEDKINKLICQLLDKVVLLKKELI